MDGCQPRKTREHAHMGLSSPSCSPGWVMLPQLTPIRKCSVRTWRMAAGAAGAAGAAERVVSSVMVSLPSDTDAVQPLDVAGEIGDADPVGAAVQGTSGRGVDRFDALEPGGSYRVAV